MIKENINKIDYDLKNLFSEVKISEKTDRGNYFFEVNATDYTQFKGEKKEAQVRVEISKPDLMRSVVKWSYYTNPLNENSEKIERISFVDNIAVDIHEILTGHKMETEYFESLDSLYELINESVTTDQKELEEKLEDILNKYQIEEKISEKFDVDMDGNKPEKTIVYNKDLKMSEKFNLESEVKSIGIEYISFSGTTIKIKF